MRVRKKRQVIEVVKCLGKLSNRPNDSKKDFRRINKPQMLGKPKVLRDPCLEVIKIRKGKFKIF